MANGAPLLGVPLPAIQPDPEEELRERALRELGPGLLAPRTPALAGGDGQMLPAVNGEGAPENGQMLPAVNGEMAPAEAAAPVLPAIAEDVLAAAPEEAEQGPGIERFLLPAIAGLAVGQSIANRDISPLAQGAAGFFAGRQGAQMRAEEAEAEERDRLAQLAPTVSVGPQGAEISGVRPGVEGLEGTTARALEQFGELQEQFPAAPERRVFVDALGRPWSIDDAAGTAEPIAGPAGDPVEPVQTTAGFKNPILDESGRVIGYEDIPGGEATPEAPKPVKLPDGSMANPIVDETGRTIGFEPIEGGGAPTDDAANQVVDLANRAEELLAEGALTGPLVGSGAGRLGLQLFAPEKAALQSEFNAAMSRIAFGMLQNFKGQMSNRELEFVLEVSGGRTLTQEENYRLINLARDVAERAGGTATPADSPSPSSQNPFRQGGGGPNRPAGEPGASGQTRSRQEGSAAVPSSFEGNRSGAEGFAPLINEAAARHGIPQDIAFALVQTESNFDPQAKSSANAIGLTQVLPGTARDMGYDPGKLTDPTTSLDAGFRYLADQFRTFGDWEKALLAYHSGPGNVRSGKIGPRGRAYVPTIRKHGGGI